MPRPRCRADRAATSRRPLPGQSGTSRVLALQTRELRRGCFILSAAASKTCHPQTPSPSQHPGGKLFAFCVETSLFNSPRDDIFCFVCLLCAPTPEAERHREKSLHDCMSQIKSKQFPIYSPVAPFHLPLSAPAT